MPADRIALTFYHSVVCPRCQVTGLLLRGILKKHPRVELTRVELLKNMSRARQDGVTSIPALVAEGRVLTGIILTPARIERFLESLA